jgi:head-tail adaptor
VCVHYPATASEDITVDTRVRVHYPATASEDITVDTRVRVYYPATASEDITVDTRVCVHYPATASEDITVDTRVHVTVNCKVQSRTVSKSPINPVLNQNLSVVTLHTHYSMYDIH